MGWMAFTWQTAIFFAAIAALLAGLICAELRWPTRQRKGWLPIATTRGDRAFITLLGSAFVHIGWLAASALWIGWASLLCCLLAWLVMRYG